MVQVSSETAEINSEQMTLSAEAWAQNPVEVQEYILSTLIRLQALETKVAEL